MEKILNHLETLYLISKTYQKSLVNDLSPKKDFRFLDQICIMVAPSANQSKFQVKLKIKVSKDVDSFSIAQIMSLD